jgi:hypothetical protein
MRNGMKVRHVLGGGLVLAAVLSWSPTAMADGEKPVAPGESLIIQNEIHFGPQVFGVERSTTASGEELTLKLDQGTSFTYLEGREIDLEIEGEVLNISIQDDLVLVGNKASCSSADIACIVHAIRKQLKGLTPDHSALGLAAVQYTLRSMQFGGAIAQVFYALATMPQGPEDED